MSKLSSRARIGVPDSTFPLFARALGPCGVAYLHVVEPHGQGSVSDNEKRQMGARSLRPKSQAPMIAAHGFDVASVGSILNEGDADLVAVGPHFRANLDIPDRMRLNLQLNLEDRNTLGEKGYADYPIQEEAAA
jgi:N-ethylmaleimide reductase